MQVSNLSLVVHTVCRTQECEGPISLYTVICAYQCSSLQQGANESAKQKLIHKIPQVALFIYLHFSGGPDAKSRWYILDRKWKGFKMESSLKGSENGQRAATQVSKATSGMQATRSSREGYQVGGSSTLRPCMAPYQKCLTGEINSNENALISNFHFSNSISRLVANPGSKRRCLQGAIRVEAEEMLFTR